MVDSAALAAIFIALLPVLSVSLLAGAALGMPLVRRFNPAGRFLWGFAFIAITIAWLCLLGSGSRLPNFLQSPPPETENILAVRPAFIIDGTSWPIGVALLTLLMAIFLKEFDTPEHKSTILWSGMLALTASGLVGIFASTPLTLMLAWVAVDLIEGAVMLYQIDAPEIRRQYILSIGFRMLSIYVIYSASALFQAAEYDLTLMEYAPAEIIYFLLAAAILRLGILPLHDPFFKERSLRRGLGTLTRLINVSVASILICRLASAKYPAESLPWPLICTAAVTLFAAVYWWKADGEITGRMFWILGLTGLSIAGMLLSLPLVSITWVLVLVLAGSELFVNERRDRRGRYLALAGLALCSGLSFTPAWVGMAVFNWEGAPVWFSWMMRILFMLALVFLLAGYYRHAQKGNPAPSEEEHPGPYWGETGGAFLLLVMYIGSGVWMMSGAPTVSWIPGAVAAGGTLSVILFQDRVIKGRRKSSFAADEQKTIPIDSGLALPAPERKLPARFFARLGSLRRIVSLNGVYIFLFRFFDFFRRLFRMMTRILESEGGFLWALLVFILLISFVFRPAGGR